MELITGLGEIVVEDDLFSVEVYEKDGTKLYAFPANPMPLYPVFHLERSVKILNDGMDGKSPATAYNMSK